MRMLTVLLMAALLLCGGAACGKKKKGAKTTETQKTAGLTPAQRAAQRQKAIKAYEKLVEKYPNSPYAEKAKERLAQLKAQEPAK